MITPIYSNHISKWNQIQRVNRNKGNNQEPADDIDGQQAQLHAHPGVLDEIPKQVQEEEVPNKPLVEVRTLSGRLARSHNGKKTL